MLNPDLVLILRTSPRAAIPTSGATEEVYASSLLYLSDLWSARLAVARGVRVEFFGNLMRTQLKCKQGRLAFVYDTELWANHMTELWATIW